MIPATDLQAVALSRLAQQYEGSTKLKAVISMFITMLLEARDAILTLESLRKIDTAEGDGLDGIGEILGQPRALSGVVPIAFFELHDGTGGPAAEGFGDTGDASAGLRFRHISENPSVNAEMGDEEMRRFLHAKVLRNTTSATPEDIISNIRAVLVGNSAVFITFGTTAITATVQRVISQEEVDILNAESGIRGQIPVIPRPIGVELTVAGL